MMTIVIVFLRIKNYCECNTIIYSKLIVMTIKMIKHWPDHQVQAPACTTSLSGETRLYNPGGVGTAMAKYIYPNSKIYLSKLLKTFVKISKYICQNFKINLWNILNIFFQNAEYICPNCQIYLSKLPNTSVYIAKCISWNFMGRFAFKLKKKLYFISELIFWPDWPGVWPAVHSWQILELWIPSCAGCCLDGLRDRYHTCASCYQEGLGDNCDCWLWLVRSFLEVRSL